MIAFRLDCQAIQRVPLLACRLVDSWLRPLFESIRIGLDQAVFPNTGLKGRTLIVTESSSNGRSQRDLNLHLAKYPRAYITSNTGRHGTLPNRAAVETLRI